MQSTPNERQQLQEAKKQLVTVETEARTVVKIMTVEQAMLARRIVRESGQHGTHK